MPSIRSRREAAERRQNAVWSVWEDGVFCGLSIGPNDVIERLERICGRSLPPAPPANVREGRRIKRRVPVQGWIAAREALVALWLDRLGWHAPTAKQITRRRQKAAHLIYAIERDPARAWRRFVDATGGNFEIGFMKCVAPKSLSQHRAPSAN